MQIMTIEFARTKLKDQELTSEEFDEAKKINPEKYIIHFLPDQNLTRKKGGTLRLGAYECLLDKKSIAYQVYKKIKISERHRHRYEFNSNFRKILEKNGIIFSGINPQLGLVEIAEIKGHPFMLGCQFHPEFLSRPMQPHPLFKKFIKKSLELQVSK